MLAARIARAALAAAVLASIGLSPLARAADTSQEMMPASYADLMKMKPMDVMKMIDKDKKGYVTKEEFMKFHEAMFDKMDKDKNGQISKEEWAAKH